LPSKHGERTEKDAPEQTPSDRIGIVGFAPAGQQVATALLEQGITPFVIELNPKTAGIARKVCEVLSRKPGLALACGLAGESSQPTTI
jgi:hypothetical protein